MVTQSKEYLVKNRVKKVLKKYAVYQHWPVLNGMGAPTLDCIGCANGKFFAIETKAENKQPTERQLLTIRSMEAAGAKTFVINEVTGTDELEHWLQAVQEK